MAGDEVGEEEVGALRSNKTVSEGWVGSAIIICNASRINIVLQT